MTTIADPEAVPTSGEFPAGGGVLPHWKDGAPFAGESDRTAPINCPRADEVVDSVLSSHIPGKLIRAGDVDPRDKCG